MGGMYYVANAGLYTGYYIGNGNYNFFGDISMLGWIVYGVIIGYMAGALNKRSEDFRSVVLRGANAGSYNFALATAATMSATSSAGIPAGSRCCISCAMARRDRLGVSYRATATWETYP